MGIRGLTTFIDQNHDQSFLPYHLHNCNLVIDGNSVASQLYVREFTSSKRSHCAFGGDYDEYARTVKRFFTLLSCCEVKPIVIFDGGREPRKSSTRLSRLKESILAISRLNPDNCSRCPLPLLMLEAFKWIALRSGATIGVCNFEADEEIAALARALSCPLLSFDSDFYIHAVPFYIPFPTLATELTEEVRILNEGSSGTILRYLECSAFSVNKFLSRNNVGNWKRKSTGTRHILQVEVLPLIAALLGNDYVKPKTFHHFLSKIAIPKSKCRNQRQRAIVGLLEWLRLEESLESAIRKILSHTKKGQRDQLENIIQETVKVYVGCPSELLHHLNLSASITPDIKSVEEVKETAESNLKLKQTMKEECKEIESLQIEDERTLDKNKCSENKEDEVPSVQSLASSLESDDQSLTEEDDDYSDSEVSQHSECALDDEDVSWNERRDQLPTWFLERFRKGSLPSPFMDILMQRMYLCPPQVEDQSRPHSHAISFPILSAILRLLTPSIETPLVCWTRVDRHAASLALDPLPKNSSCPAAEDLLVTPACSRIKILLQLLKFTDGHADKDTVRMLSLESLPSDWRLLALSLAYWRRNSTLHKENEHFMIAACFCIVVLRVIDVRAGPPGRKSRKVRRDKNKLHMQEEVETSVVTLSEGNKNLGANLKQDSGSVDRGVVNVSIPEGVHIGMQFTKRSVKELLQLVNTADCVRVSTFDGNLVQLRQYDEDMVRGTYLNCHMSGRKRPRPFNLTTVHCFSELQSVILHVGYLNSVLGEPFVINAPHTSFSGTLVYNAFCYINGKSPNSSSKKSYWEILLGTSAPSLENLMDAFFKCVLLLAWGEDTNESSSDKKTRRRKRNKNKDMKQNRTVVMENSDKESEESVYDPQNKYSLLNLIELKR